MINNWLTIDDTLKLHPERGERWYKSDNSEYWNRIWKRKNAIVRWRLVRGWSYERVAKKFGVSVGYVQYVVTQYREWEREQAKS